jgi:succinate dehydrogenase/fumarate reductase flavoprotein subunit
MQLNLATLPDTGAAFDLVVVGAGGAGLSAALFGALAGARVLVVEHTEFVGGTTALSAGTSWVPLSKHAAQVNAGDTLADAERYLDAVVGTQSDAALRRAFLQQGPEAVAELEAQTDVRYRPYPLHPDYESDQPGATLQGRALEPLPFDGRKLGPLFGLIRPPIPEFTVLGGMMVDRTDINHLLGMTGSFKSLSHSVKILARHALDRLNHPRGTRLVMGNALVARLLHSLSKQPGVQLAMQTSLVALHAGEQGVEALTLEQHGVRRRIVVCGGVVLASGGYNRHPQRRAQLLPGSKAEWCPAAPGHTGQAQVLAEQLGAQFTVPAQSPAFWAPVSKRARADGSTAVFPHFVMDRAKPGFITVNQAGERFVNESTSYHRFGLAMQAAHTKSPTVPAYLICDAEALRRYGIGMVRPGGKGLAPFLADGYLTQGESLEALAKQLGISATGLAASVAQLNACAAQGRDSSFGRGSTAYQRNLGDATRGLPNPNLGALGAGPYYAVKLYPGDIGAAAGLRTDASARVLGQGDEPIAGLYAVGNDMQSIMGGAYPGPGITIGPGMVFGRIAARHATQRARTMATHGATS